MQLTKDGTLYSQVHYDSCTLAITINRSAWSYHHLRKDKLHGDKRFGLCLYISLKLYGEIEMWNRYTQSITTDYLSNLGLSTTWPLTVGTWLEFTCRTSAPITWMMTPIYSPYQSLLPPTPMQNVAIQRNYLPIMSPTQGCSQTWQTEEATTF